MSATLAVTGLDFRLLNNSVFSRPEILEDGERHRRGRSIDLDEEEQLAGFRVITLGADEEDPDVEDHARLRSEDLDAVMLEDFLNHNRKDAYDGLFSSIVCATADPLDLLIAQEELSEHPDFNDQAFEVSEVMFGIRSPDGEITLSAPHASSEPHSNKKKLAEFRRMHAIRRTAHQDEHFLVIAVARKTGPKRNQMRYLVRFDPRHF